MPSPRTAVHGFIRPCLALFFTAFSSVLHAAPEDCLQDGGQATCTSPISVPGPWQHALCDDFAAYLGRVAAWCVVMGGTWNGPYAPEACAGGDFVAGPPETKLYPYAEAFEQRIHNVQSCPITGQDGGWLSPVQTINSWNCWSGGPVVQNGIEVRNLREMLFSGQSYNATTQSCEGSWSERVIALRTRQLQVGCADGYTLRIGTGGQQECFAMAAQCPVAPLTPYSPDPYPLDIDNLTPRMQTTLQCLQTAIRDDGGTSSASSAYRPPAYNRHLQEVWDKWMRELRRETRPECQSLRNEVRNHFNGHELIPDSDARPHSSSAHTRGEAFDLSSNLYDGVLDVLAVGCRVYRPDPIGDPPHFIHR